MLCAFDFVFFLYVHNISRQIFPVCRLLGLAYALKSEIVVLTWFHRPYKVYKTWVGISNKI